MIKVTYAKLHASLFVPSAGHIGDTLPPVSKTLPDFKMQLIENGSLLLSWGKDSRFVVAAANVIGCALAPEDSHD